LYGITQFSSSFLALLMIPVYTFYFTPTQFGTWDLIMTTLALLSPFITFELIAASYRWLLDAKTKEERVTIISTSIITICRNLLILDSIIFIVVSFFTLNINYLWESLLLLNC